MGCQGGTEEEVAHLLEGEKKEWLYKDATETGSERLYLRHNAGT